MQRLLDQDGFVLVSSDPATGKRTWLRDNGDGTMTQRTDMPHDATVEENAEFRNSASGKMGDWVRVASIPANIYWDENLGLQKAMQQEDEKYVSRWLNDGDNRAWRTKDGRF